MKKVLIVDDAAFIRVMIKDALKEGYEIVGEAVSGEDSVALFQEKEPDIVTMDISLEGKMTGIDALRSILKIKPTAKVVMVSAMGDDHNIKTSIELGAFDFIVKPFSKDKIRTTVELALK